MRRFMKKPRRADQGNAGAGGKREKITNLTSRD